MKDIPLNNDSNMNDIFFDFFPCTTGHTLLTDTYHSSCNSLYYSTVQSDKIKLYDPDIDDPDLILKVAYTLMIAVV